MFGAIKLVSNIWWLSVAFTRDCRPTFDNNSCYMTVTIITVVIVIMNVTMCCGLRILRVLCEKVRLAPDLNLQHLAQLTPGYVGVDLRFLVTKAGQICIKRSLYLTFYNNFTVLLLFMHSLHTIYVPV